MAINEKQTTVTIDQGTSKKLDRLAVTNGLSKKEFINQALDYFEKFGINPTQNETPILEMDRIRKRQDQVVAFLKTQEKNILEPSLLGIAKADESMRIRLNKFEELLYRLASEESLVERTSDIRSYMISLERDILSGNKTIIASITTSFRDHLKVQQDNQKKTDQALLAIVQYLDKKGKEGIFDKVSNLLK